MNYTKVDNAELIEEFRTFKKGKQVNIVSKYYEASVDLGVETATVYVTNGHLITNLQYRDQQKDQYYQAKTTLNLIEGTCYKKEGKYADRIYKLVYDNGYEIRFEFAIVKW